MKAIDRAQEIRNRVDSTSANGAAEDARRLARYPEAIALLRRVKHSMRWEDWISLLIEVQAFLATEPAERGEGGAG